MGDWSEYLGRGSAGSDQATSLVAYGKVQHQVGVSPVPVTVDDLGVVGRCGDMELEWRLCLGAKGDREGNDAQFQPASRARQAIVA
ncbi:hypothetical protein GCM10020216_034120 [Nonomuraea helvata]